MPKIWCKFVKELEIIENNYEEIEKHFFRFFFVPSSEIQSSIQNTIVLVWSIGTKI